MDCHELTGGVKKMCEVVGQVNGTVGCAKASVTDGMGSTLHSPMGFHRVHEDFVEST